MTDPDTRYRLRLSAGLHQPHPNAPMLATTEFVSVPELASLEIAVAARRSAIHYANVHPGIQQWMPEQGEWRDMSLEEWRHLQ